MSKKKVVVVGGGTAGLLTALWARKHIPEASVTVIRSPNVPSIGVGEASTPSLVGFLESLAIDPIDLIKNTGGTIKNGISFENWKGKGSKYFHGFSPKGPLAGLLGDCKLPPHFEAGVYSYYEYHALARGLPLDNILYSSLLSKENKVDLDNTNWAIQFDAVRVAKYLEKIAKSRGVEVLLGTYSYTNDTCEGLIESLVLESGEVVPLDLLFDCTGLSRLFIGKKFEQEWDSYSKYLPMDRAIPFRMPAASPLPSHTKAIAMSSGWMWSTPLQDMTGYGYVYDSNYITAEEAQIEAEEYLGANIEVARVLKFDIGQYKKVWVKNCIAVGMSTGFAEPLEATSVHMSISQLMDLTHFINHLFEYNKNSVESYNSNNYRQNRAVLDFIYLHYISKRADSPFWREFQSRNPVPPSLSHKLELLREGNLRFFDLEVDQIWELSNYLQVADGLGIIENTWSVSGYENLYPSLDERTSLFEGFAANSVDHKSFMDEILKGPDQTENYV